MNEKECQEVINDDEDSIKIDVYDRVIEDIWELDLPQSHILILLAMCHHAFDFGIDNPPSVLRLAWKTGYEERQVRRILRQLKDADVISLTKRGNGPGNPNRYRINIAAIPAKPHFKEYNDSRPKRQPITLKLFAQVWDKSDGVCWYCGEQTDSMTNFSIDHFIPLSKGGTDEVSNMVPSCRRCNMMKGDRLVPEVKKGMIERISKSINKNLSIYDPLDDKANELMEWLLPEYRDRKILLRPSKSGIPYDDMIRFYFERRGL